MDLRKEINAFYYSAALCDLRLMNKRYVDQNISYNSLLYLELIHAMDGTCTVSRLADSLFVSRPAVTLKVKELIRQGLVLKTPDPADHRQNFLSVNEEALPQYGIYRRQDALAVEKITEKYSPEEIEKFCDMLHILTVCNMQETD